MVDLPSPYRKIRSLSSGSDAEVMLVRRTTDGRGFALKLAFPTKHAERAIYMEHKLLGELSHPNLLTAHEMIEAEGRNGLIIEYFPGTTLRESMHSDREKVIRHLGYLVEQIADALGYLHDHGICHGDVKPENILVAPGGRVRLIDLSISGGRGWGWLAPRKLAGTPKYMAPELIRRKRSTPGSDLYALGVLCYEIIAGRAPVDGATKEDILAKHLAGQITPIRHHLRSIDSRVERLVMSALSKDPARRPADCRSFGRRLGKVLRGPLEVPERLGLA